MLEPAEAGGWRVEQDRPVTELLASEEHDLVIVTGEGVRVGPILLDPMRASINETAFGPLPSDARIVIETLGDEAWAQGAASIVVHEMLTIPIYESEAQRPLNRILDPRFSRLAEVI